MRKTKIVCTLGPATDAPGVLEQLVTAGMNVARLNFSHGLHEEHQKRIDAVKELRQRTGQSIALMLDTKGPEVRIRTFLQGEAKLETGQAFTLTTREVDGDETCVSITYDRLPEKVQPGTRILLDDGLVELTVQQVQGPDIICQVRNGAVLKNRKSVNVPGVSLDMDYISAQDREDIAFGVKQDVDFIAASFVRTGRDVSDLRRLLASLGGEDINIIAKIENNEGLEHIDEILAEADGIMVARGDMGVEVPFEELPRIQKTLIAKCVTAGKKVVTATQMLESMIQNPRPTRAEVSDVANAVYDGTSAIMLSGETSIGRYPVQAVETMARIARRAEKNYAYNRSAGVDFRLLKEGGDKVSAAVAHATCTTSMDLEASAIAAFTASGYTARAVASFRPKTPILGVTCCEKTFYQLALSWGVFPMLSDSPRTEEELFQFSAQAAARSGLCRRGDLITITAGIPVGLTHQSNTLRVHRMDEKDF